MSHYGIDISSIQHPGGAAINYAAVASWLQRLGGGQGFAIVKVTQGLGYTNPYTKADVAGFRAAGMAVAGYLMDEGPADAASEEALYTRTVGQLPQADDIELPMGVTDYARKAAQLIARDGAAVVYLNQSQVSEQYPQGAGLWLAEYNGRPSETSFPCQIHPYSDAGVVPGISGPVDLDYWCASEAAFASFFAVTPTAPPGGPPQPVTSPYPVVPQGVVLPSVIVFITTDKSGCGALKLDGGLNDLPGVASSPTVNIASSSVIGVEAEGSNPAPAPNGDGVYWAHVARWQDHGGHPLVTITGAPADGVANVRVTTAQ